MGMSETDKVFIARLEAMPIEQARREIALGAFGRPGEPNHNFASSWLAVIEAREREVRHNEIQKKLEDLKKPHSWSFRLLVLSVIFALVAAIAAVLAVPQVQQVFSESPKSQVQKEQLQPSGQQLSQPKPEQPKK